MNKDKVKAIFLILLALLGLSVTTHAEVKPNSLFSDHVVLQRGQQVPVWGTASNGEQVTVKFNGQSVSTVAKNGKWILKLKAMKAGGPYTLIIAGKANKVIINDVLIGEVWLCSGQSNMERVLQGNDLLVPGSAKEVAAASYPQIRQYTVPQRFAPVPIVDADGSWSVCSPQSAGRFSMVAYYFALALQKKLHVPVGIILSANGGTRAEYWTAEKALRANPALKHLVDTFRTQVANYPIQKMYYRQHEAEYQAQYLRDSAERAKQGRPAPRRHDDQSWLAYYEPRNPAYSYFLSGLYNGMISPLIPYALKGIAWYQGEADVDKPEEYKSVLATLIGSWREDWKNNKLPFLIVQIAPYQDSTPEIREAQRWVTDRTAASALISTLDCGDSTNIHPVNKKPVGERLALAARALAYREPVEYMGPAYQSYSRKGDTLVLHFSHTGSGLLATGSGLSGFTIAATGQDYVPAKAAIHGNQVFVWSDQVHTPVSARYDWKPFPVPSLYNREGLPASSFQTSTGPLDVKPERRPFYVGANFIPSTAVNQLEMWQAGTFDPVTIDRELGYAQGIGMNCMRVYLHHVAWQQDPRGFKKRVEKFLEIANQHKVHILFVFFDDCWRDSYHAGKQPAPIPGVHNSQWLKDPGGLIDQEPLLMDTLECYVKDVLKSFGHDQRIFAWDLYNEPGHFGHGDKSRPLLKNVVKWAREVKISQPITIGVWNPEFTAFNKFQLENSDIISFHNYRDTVSLKEALDTLTKMGKPVICTEYMKRPNGSLFQTHLPIFKRYGVGAINWGLVAGKTQTNYPQGNRGGESEPAVWYHDIFRKDGTPFDPKETDLIKQITNYNNH